MREEGGREAGREEGTKAVGRSLLCKTTQLVTPVSLRAS